MSVLLVKPFSLFVLAKDGKKLREKIKKLAKKIEEEDFSDDLEMVLILFLSS